MKVEASLSGDISLKSARADHVHRFLIKPPTGICKMNDLLIQLFFNSLL